MNQFIFGIIIGAILVIVLVGIIFTAYRLGQRSQYPIMLPSDEPTTETDKEGPAESSGRSERSQGYYS